MLRCWKIIFAGRFWVWMVSGPPQTVSLYLDILLLPCWPASVQTTVIRAYGKHGQFPLRNFQRLHKHHLNFSCYDWPSYSSPSHTQVRSRLRCLWRTSSVPRHTLIHATTDRHFNTQTHAQKELWWEAVLQRGTVEALEDHQNDFHCFSSSSLNLSSLSKQMICFKHNTNHSKKIWYLVSISIISLFRLNGEQHFSWEKKKKSWFSEDILTIWQNELRFVWSKINIRS